MNVNMNEDKFKEFVIKVAKSNDLLPGEALDYVLTCGNMKVSVFFEHTGYIVDSRIHKHLLGRVRESAFIGDRSLGLYDWRTGCFFEFGTEITEDIKLEMFRISKEGIEFINKFDAKELLTE